MADPDAHGLRWLTPLRPQLAALQSCAPAERARREHAVRCDPWLVSVDLPWLPSAVSSQNLRAMKPAPSLKAHKCMSLKS